MKNENKVFAIIGKVVVAIIIIIVILPFAIDKIIYHDFIPPVNKIYVAEKEIDSAGDSFQSQAKISLTFSEDNMMYMYIIQSNIWGDMAGARYDYTYAGESFFHLLGSLYINPTPSILPWKNYEILDKNIDDRAYVKCILKNQRILNLLPTGNDDDSVDRVYLDVCVGKDFITVDGDTFHLISDDDPTDYKMFSIDKNGQDYGIN